MAPRGIPKNGPKGRMGYAYDQMRAIGFKNDQIWRELIPLQKIYGEKDWFFVEMDNCQVLLEAILKAQENDAPPQNGVENGNLLEGAPVDENAVAVPIATDSVPENLQLLTSSSAVMGAVSQPSDEDSAVEDTNMQEGENERLRLDLPALPPIPSLTAAPSRKPCYGWIGDSDDSEDELVHLPPATTRFTGVYHDNGSAQNEIVNQPRRRSRWDVAPDFD